MEERWELAQQGVSSTLARIHEGSPLLLRSQCRDTVQRERRTQEEERERTLAEEQFADSARWFSPRAPLSLFASLDAQSKPRNAFGITMRSSADWKRQKGTKCGGEVGLGADLCVEGVKV